MRPTLRPTTGPSTMVTAAVATAVLLTAAACGSTAPQPSTSAAAPAAGGAATSAATSSSSHEVSALKASSTSLGNVVTDGRGMTLYLFTKDTKGTTKSACTGQCLGYWPPAMVGSTAPKATGVSGTVGSISAPGGGKQVTLNGWPLYYYAQDQAPGDVLGQGVMNIWWVVDTSGNPIKGSGSSTTSTSGGSVGGY